MSRRLAVAASGEGSLLEAMIEEELPIELVIVDRECRARHIALDHDIQCVLIARVFAHDLKRQEFTDNMLEVLRKHKIDLVAMAGFMTVLSPSIFEQGAYRFKILNTHPSLLPAFKGSNAVEKALEHGVKDTGFTIHWVTAELDEGPILIQKTVPVKNNDTVESLHERIKKKERVEYARLLKDLVASEPSPST